MALVTKNDVTQIFAIQAPEIDLPPTFANYPRGWDTARSNNGKPTIKQFNYIQQRTDQNVLWIHQNGAALPHDATMEYAENATVVKDGVLQQWKAGVWVKVTTWSSIEGKPELYTKTEADTLFIEAAQIGQPSGVAELDANGDLDPAQFPLATDTTPGITKINNTLTSVETDAALTAAQGKVLNDKLLGVGQSWQNLTASRSVGVTYTNNTGKPILVIYQVSVANSASATATVDGIEIAVVTNNSQYVTRVPMSFIVPDGSTYSIAGTTSGFKWVELR